MSIEYPMIIRWSYDDLRYDVNLPDWGDGASTHGATYEEAVRNSYDLLRTLVEMRRRERKRLPRPGHYIVGCDLSAVVRMRKGLPAPPGPEGTQIVTARIDEE